MLVKGPLFAGLLPSLIVPRDQLDHPLETTEMIGYVRTQVDQNVMVIPGVRAVTEYQLLTGMLAGHAVGQKARPLPEMVTDTGDGSLAL